MEYVGSLSGRVDPYGDLDYEHTELFNSISTLAETLLGISDSEYCTSENSDDLRQEIDCLEEDEDGCNESRD